MLSGEKITRAFVRLLQVISLFVYFSLLSSCEPWDPVEAQEYPWIGYAWAKKANRFSWVSSVQKTIYRDCTEAIEFFVNNTDYGEDFSQPFGCAYHGNNYYDVWLRNEMWKSRDFKCISRSSDYKAAEIKMRYGPIFRTDRESRGQDWYCVENLR
jgi:hypothetical protein